MTCSVSDENLYEDAVAGPSTGPHERAEYEVETSLTTDRPVSVDSDGSECVSASPPSHIGPFYWLWITNLARVSDQFNFYSNENQKYFVWRLLL